MLLATKLIAPAPRGHLVGRPRLTGGLRHEGRRVTLLSAPAGSGKTTLLAEWIDRVRPAVAWLSLDRRDNASDRFLEHLVAAIAKTSPAMEISGLSGGGDPGLSRLEVLLNALAAADEPLTLVLDDYHCIVAETVHGLVERLLEFQPPNLHVVLSTREDPPLPISRLRVRQRLREIRTHDLQFTPDEASELLASVLGRPLGRAEVETLCSRTEGWAAGLQLAGLSLRSATDPREVIEGFSGENRHIVDYLTDEVLAGLDPDCRDFMLRTSILEALCAPLCQALGLDDAERHLAHLERANLFLVSLDQSRNWYRYHHLFAELLRSRLLARDGATEVARLEIGAARWYAEVGELEAAIEHAVSALARKTGSADAGHALDLLLPLLERHGHRLFTRARRSQVQAWLDRLPDEIKLARPALALLTAKVCIINQRRQEALRYLEAAEQMSGATTLPAARRAALRGEVAVVRASIALHRWQMDEVLRFAEKALADLPKADASNRSHAMLSAGLASRWLGRLRSAHTSLGAAAEEALISGDALIVIAARTGLARLLLEQGRPVDAEASCREALALCEQRRWHRYPSMVFLYLALAEILWERGQDDAAQEELRKAFEQHRLVRDPRRSPRREVPAVARGLFKLIGEAPEAGPVPVPETVPAESRILPLLPQIDEVRARLCLRSGAIEPVRAWLDREGVTPRGPFVPGLFGRYLVLARVLLAEGRTAEAADLLGRLLAAFESAGLRRYSVDGFACLALARRRLGLGVKACEAMGQAVELAAGQGAPGEGTPRAFVEIGPELVPLLEPLAEDYPALVPRLLATLGHQEPATTIGLVEPLSERELEVLALLYGGFSNQEIADRLFVSRNTVKTHVRNIYGKIGAKSRGQAIARIRELGLL